METWTIPVKGEVSRKLSSAPLKQAWPAIGVGQAGAVPPVPLPSHCPVAGVSVVLAPQGMAPTHSPPAVVAPASTSQLTLVGSPSTGTHLREPSFCCTCSVPGPHVAELHAGSATTASKPRAMESQRFIHSSGACSELGRILVEVHVDRGAA